MSETNKIEYNKTALEIISSLTGINQSVVFERDEDDEDRIVSKSSDSNRSIAYVFEAPQEVFNFEGDECSFYNFNEFYTLFNVFENPELEQNDSEITVKENRSKIKFRLTDSELVKKSFNKVKFEDADIEFVMDSELIKRIKTLASGNSVNADRIKFSVEGEELTYKLYNTKHHNTFDEKLDVENEGDVEFTIEVDMKIWNKIPNASYKISMKEEGILRLEMVRDDEISVQIFTADMEDS